MPPRVRRGRPRRPPPEEARNEQIRAAFRRPGHATAFSAPGAVARAHNISYKKAREILEEVGSYVTHREYKRPAVFNPYFVYRRRSLVQADLIDIRQLARSNAGTNYLLLLIDVFSRRIWVYPLKSKTGQEVRDALQRWLDAIGQPPPAVFATDFGREFLNHHVGELLRARGVRQETAKGTCKAAVAERANKTLQILLYKYMSENDTRTYIDKLDRLVYTYNHRGHRTLEFMAPATADQPRNEERVRGIHVTRYARVKRKKANFRVGQIVRVKLESKAMAPQSRAYQPQFKEEYFIIRDINRRLPIPMYYLEGMNDGDPIEGGFYSNELTAVRGDVFKIQHILAERGEGPNRELLVRWANFGPRWDSWIPATNVRDIRARRGRPRAAPRAPRAAPPPPT